MDPASLIVPVIASLALGGALLVPIRDGRQGRKATVLGRTPLNVDFSGIAETIERTAATAGETVPSNDTLASPPPVALDDAGVGDDPAAAGNPVAETTPDRRFASDAEAFEKMLASFAYGSDERAVEAEPNPLGLEEHHLQTTERSSTANAKPPVSNAPASFKAFVDRFRRRPSVEPVMDRPGEREAVIERSFASELTALIPLSKREDEPGLRAPRMPEVASDSRDEPPVANCETDVASLTISSVMPKANRLHAAGIERIVPLTRRPLRAARAIGWPASVDPQLHFESDTERYDFLRRCAKEPPVDGDALLARAFDEETSVGRGLVLAAFSRTNASSIARETFVAALTTGSDDERSFAIDALADIDAREEIALGLTDRIDAIAAKAALAYVGTTGREDYRMALAPYLDEARIDSLLTLLAGIVE